MFLSENTYEIASIKSHKNLVLLPVSSKSSTYTKKYVVMPPKAYINSEGLLLLVQNTYEVISSFRASCQAHVLQVKLCSLRQIHQHCV